MDTFSIHGIQHVRAFDQKAQLRAEKHEHLRERNNVTSCRSPTREFVTKILKNELKEKRHLEFLRRRSVSPERCCEKSTRQRKSALYFTSNRKTVKFSSKTQDSFISNGQGDRISTVDSTTSDRPGTVQLESLWSEQLTLMRQRGQVKKQAATSIHVVREMNRTNATSKTENHIKDILQNKILRDANVQTESGFVVVKESDIQQLAEYLQDALWREEVVRKKLLALQESTSIIMTSSNQIWTAQCSQDLLQNKIKALEAQLQVCLQKFPKDGVKRLALHMEKQKMIYEEKALSALQRATQEKTEALIKAETLQEALTTTKAESQKWQRLYEELKLSSAQLRERQPLSDEQLQQLLCQIELSRTTEAKLREELLSMRQEGQELRYNIALLQEDKQILRKEIQDLREGGNDNEDFMMLNAEEVKPQLTIKRDSQVEEQLLYTQEMLKVKEKECEELQTELHAMEQECQSSQTRLSQCRDELRQLRHHHRRPTPFVSWWRVCVFFLLFLFVAGVATLWLWHPPFREQVEDLYSDIETRIEDYLMEMASPRQSGCFRPI